MENKYYTPTEDEIRVGLYCVYTTLVDGFREDSFLKPYNAHEDDIVDCTEEGLEPYEIKILFDLFDTIDDICNQVRVKYLDREDIESFLGEDSYQKSGTTKRLNDESHDMFNSKNLNITIVHHPNINKISIITLDPFKNEAYERTNWDDKQINLISCKNKSEFKDILEKLDII